MVTSDRPEQLIASGHAAMRTSAREFREEVNRVRGGIAAFLARNNRGRPDRSIEKAYKEAWMRKRGAGEPTLPGRGQTDRENAEMTNASEERRE